MLRPNRLCREQQQLELSLEQLLFQCHDVSQGPDEAPVQVGLRPLRVLQEEVVLDVADGGG